MYNLERFVEAQERIYDIALNEIKEGFKASHWMWFIFPQVHGLGFSYMAEIYAISGIEEAREYLAHPVLGKRLEEISHALLDLDESDPVRILGGIDAMKLCSSMTLFHVACPEKQVFMDVLLKFYDGKTDEKTLEILKQ